MLDRTVPRLLALVIALSGAGALSQTTATIDIDPAHTTPLNSHFSGFNDEAVFAAEYFHYRFNTAAPHLSPWWVRDPSGIFADATGRPGGLGVTVYSGPVAAYAGLDQVNVTIPRSLAGTGTVLVYLVADGVASNVVSLNMQ